MDQDGQPKTVSALAESLKSFFGERFDSLKRDLKEKQEDLSSRIAKRIMDERTFEKKRQ